MSRFYSNSRKYQDLGAGFMLGLAFVGVAFGIIGATRRVSKRRAMRRESASIPRIDGARPLDPVLLDARPQEMPAPPLVNEIEDYAPTSQRW